MDKQVNVKCKGSVKNVIGFKPMGRYTFSFQYVRDIKMYGLSCFAQDAKFLYARIVCNLHQLDIAARIVEKKLESQHLSFLKRQCGKHSQWQRFWVLLLGWGYMR